MMHNKHQHKNKVQSVAQKGNSSQFKTSQRKDEEKKTAEVAGGKKENFLKECLSQESALQTENSSTSKVLQSYSSPSVEPESSFEEDEEEKIDLASVEGIVSFIKDQHINCVKLLNTVKMKKKIEIDYRFPEKFEPKTTL